MSKAIWKFSIKDLDVDCVSMPKGAEILDVGIQRGEIQIWAIVDPDANTEDRSFSIYGTGMIIDPEGKKYLKTIFVQNGDFIWHIFEILK